MNHIRHTAACFFTSLLSLAVAVTAGAAMPQDDEVLFGMRDEKPFAPAVVDAVGDRVADWQIDRLDDLTYHRNYRDNISERRAWIHGAFYVGVFNWAALPGNERFFDPLQTIAEEEEWKLGDRLFHGDDHIVGQMYLTLYNREEEKDRDKIEHTIRQFNQILAADPDGSLAFEGDSIRGVGRTCQIRWCWCDALFMSPQTWIMLTSATGDEKYTEFADTEFWATTDYLMDPDTHLYFRDSRYFTQQDEEGNKIFWARGNGWVYAGLVNILRLLPKDHPSYPKYVQLYKDMSETIADLQHDNGFWRVSLLAKEKYASPETSGTGFMTYGLAWGVNQGLLDEDKYGPAIRKGWKALLSAVQDDGMLGWVQPIGAAPDSVYESDSQLYGVGAFLLTAEQMIEFEE
ncbi:MAG: glycoside hydrolase family 88 protein [Xanthomonadales bacterium]|nr:glycoside hydrolase family 88 protein [Gammaproteobacteria bacterium]MBT8050464.1 glycoside hydrolase family 88 protein [Gammaproteobacteria bacterium]MBT8055537.1 glycoside hydrolase family 88 protein [Gammaproteobacteria bacterium]NNJ79675.1 glycoside hydrolase family 88 protein [Xanthomonadales bacterium]NNL04333.1 glycoside hydrolase family 88 protein [Xanthomonadales bacterium]